MVQQRKNQANGYKVKLKRRGKAKQKVKKSKEKMREKRTPPQKLNFGRALVGLCLWRSTATYSITRDMAAPLLMQGAGGVVGEGEREEE
jgi:hypothetical protein